jgi:hypothetical protein
VKSFVIGGLIASLCQGTSGQCQVAATDSIRPSNDQIHRGVPNNSAAVVPLTDAQGAIRDAVRANCSDTDISFATTSYGEDEVAVQLDLFDSACRLIVADDVSNSVKFPDRPRDGFSANYSLIGALDAVNGEENPILARSFDEVVSNRHESERFVPTSGTTRSPLITSTNSLVHVAVAEIASSVASTESPMVSSNGMEMLAGALLLGVIVALRRWTPRQSDNVAAAPAETIAITVPAIAVAAEEQSIASVDFPTAPVFGQRVEVPCPACAELILAKAKKCKYCGYWVVGAGGGSPQKSRFKLNVNVRAITLLLAGLALCGVALTLKPEPFVFVPDSITFSADDYKAMGGQNLAFADAIYQSKEKEKQMKAWEEQLFLPRGFYIVGGVLVLLGILLSVTATGSRAPSTSSRK